MNKLWLSFFKVSKYLCLSDVSSESFTSPINKSVELNRTIFVYWNTGLDNAPAIVRRCVKSILAIKNHPVVLLTSFNIKEFVELPDYIENLHRTGKMGEAFYSDILRTNLLVRYGGIWFDATCFVPNVYLPKWVESSSFLMFQEDLAGISPRICDNWFIKADKGNPILMKVQNYIFSFFRSHTKTIHYFMFHLILSAIVKNDECCYKIWLNQHYICSMNAYVLIASFEKSYNENTYANILNSCFVHKLSWKLNREFNNQTIYQHFINE